MTFTPLHQALGAQPCPLTSEMIHEAIEAGIEESDQIDWKTELPPERALAQSDVIKDIAAFANRVEGYSSSVSRRRVPRRRVAST